MCGIQRYRHSRTAKVLSAFAVLLIAPAFHAPAATITVSSLDDTVSGSDGQCTLREAIIAANTGNASGGSPGECPAGEFAPVIDRIEFASAATGTLSLTDPLPILLDPVEIVGPGPSDLIVDGTSVTTNTGALRVMAEASIQGLTIANTVSTGAGGAINASRPLTITAVAIEDNQATTGGGIYSTRDLTVESSVFRRNLATDLEGGAIRLADADRKLTVRDSLFEDNAAGPEARSGGAIHVGGTGHDTVISQTTFVGNKAEGGNRDGGAIRIAGASFILDNSTFTDNTATGSGGAVSLRAVGQELSNVTLAANTADSDGDGIGDGGGLWLQGSVFAVVRNTLVSGNDSLAGSGPDCSGSYTTVGYNLIGRGEGCSGFTNDVGGDQVGTSADPIDPLLGPLSGNGGPTPTLALLAGSPAIDAGDPAGCEDALGDPLTVDQRGRQRPTDGDGDGNAVCDIGAFEAAAAEIFTDRFQALP
jgi:CSLREA domain-containing protein